MDLQVRHDEKKKRFVAEVEGRECALDYERLDDRTLEYHHTFTPEPLRRRGIMSEVVGYALDWAARNDHRVVATCPFVKGYVERHPETRKVVTRAA